MSRDMGARRERYIMKQDTADLGRAKQACDHCGRLVPVNAISPSECFCSAECCERYAEAEASLSEQHRQIVEWLRKQPSLVTMSKGHVRSNSPKMLADAIERQEYLERK